MKKTLGAIILAAGRGKRMNSKHHNKVVLPLAQKPMILHEIEFLQKLHISPVVVVVGFAKKSVEEVLKDISVMYAVQKKRLGTAHAVATALSTLPQSIEHVLVIQGDDSFFYRGENLSLIKDLIQKHFTTNASITFLTVELNNPFGLGRVVRDEKGDVIAIVEEKDATEKKRKIQEINPACYIFKTKFLRAYIKKIKKSEVTGEYYLVSLVELAVSHKEKIETLRAGKRPWRGVNTQEELQEAENLYRQIST